jgi:hypothetical protein
MSLGIWGNAGWTFMHFISFAYPVNPSVSDKQRYRQFFESIQHVLPCPKCRVHFAKNMKKYDLNVALESRDGLVQWVVDMHNEVNKVSGKPAWTKEQVIKYYTEMAQAKQSTNWMTVAVGGGALGFLLWYMLKRADEK